MNRQPDAQTGRQTERERDRQTNRVCYCFFPKLARKIVNCKGKTVNGKHTTRIFPSTFC